MDKRTLASQIAQLALLRGDFTLRSGRKSKYYLDKYLFSTQPAILNQLGDLFADAIRVVEAESATPAHRLAGAELGGIPLVTVASLKTNKPAIFVRSAKKDYGTAKLVEGAVNPDENIIFVEDVATTGGQALEAVNTLRELGAHVLAVIAVIDRQEGARENIERAGLRFHALFTRQDLGITE